MKYQLHKSFSLLIFSLLAFSQTATAQQGGLDTTFGTNNMGIYQDNLTNENDPNDGRGYTVSEVLADGKIVVAGKARKYIGGGEWVDDFMVRRLNADGSPDTTFGTLGAAQTTFLRFGTDPGQQSTTLGITMKVQPSDGKIVVAGYCWTRMALGSDLCLVRYNQNGTIDTSFGGNTVTAWFGYGPPPETFTMDAGKVFTRVGVAEGNPAVTLNGFDGSPSRIRIATDGRIYVFGNGRDYYFNNGWNFKDKGFVAIYSTSGVLQQIISLVDTTGNNNDGFGSIRIGDGDLLSNGNYVAVGTHQQVISVNPTVRSAVRWKIFSGNSGGGFLDNDVNTGGVPVTLTMLRSNKILVGGSFGNAPNFTPALVRYNGDLTVDTTFGANGRYNFAGTLVPNYADRIFELKTQPDGKILGKTNVGGILRLNPNGSPDLSFGRVRDDVADSLSIRGILSAGRYATPFASGGDLRIAYGGVSFQSNGRLITGGETFNGRYAIVTRLKTSFRNGGTFSDFNNDGKAEVAVFRSGTWYYLDSFSNAFSGISFGAATDKPVPADYDGDGKSDVAVYRPSSGIWYIYQSSNNQVRGVQFGAAEDLPRPGDFNGDGFADIAVFRPSSGTWYILYSNPIQPGNITFSAVAFGQSGDVPLLADFDGDGKSDIAVYRAGVWYYLRSTDGGFRSVNFGAAGDIPTVGDYDADAKADVAVFRPSNGVWYRLNSSTGAFVFNQFGQNGDKPVPGDYDNDGKTDLAVFRSGIWYALRSADNSVLGISFGAPTDVPIPAAYLP